MTKQFIPIILGTDINSYTVASLIHDRYNIKPVVVGTGILIPFYKSNIADLHIQSDILTDEKILSQYLNDVYNAVQKNNEIVIFFIPSENYLEYLLRASEYLNFKHIIPYPSMDKFEITRNKNKFYEKLERLGFKVPHTFSANKDNYKEVMNHFEDNRKLFMKASNYEHFSDADLKDYQKGYFLQNSSDALFELEKIYSQNYDGEMIVQEYINGDYGCEYSLNGYRSANNIYTIAQGRSLISDPRDKWVGNHLVIVDSKIPEIYELAKRLTEELGLYGLFNIDFKIDSVTKEIYILECNPRQGRSFYYTYLAGVNLMEAAIDDTIFNRPLNEVGYKDFAWIVASKEATKEFIPKSLKNEFNNDRLRNSDIILFNKNEKDKDRSERIKKYQKEIDNTFINVFNI